MKVKELFEGMRIRCASECPDVAERLEIERIVTSPEQACERTLYVACQTAISNGRRGMEFAYARGCRAFLCANDACPGKDAVVWIAEDPEQLLGALSAILYGHPARTMTVIGITGSTGKTAVTAQTVRVLREAGKRVCALSSDGLDLLGEVTYPGAVVPDAAYIQQALTKMAACKSEIAVLELSSYQLAHFAAESIPFTAVLLTNLSVRHVGNGEHATREAYYAAKLSLLRKPSAFCVVPVKQDIQTDARVLRVGANGDAWAENVHRDYSKRGEPTTRFSLCTKEEKCEITLPVTGDISIENALCTAMLCRVIGLEMSQIVKGLSCARVSGRLECLSSIQERLIYLDAAFLPQDLECALQTLRPLTKGRLCVLFGCVGGRAKTRRTPFVQIAEHFADHLYLTADDPDFEDPLQICEELRDAMAEPMRATVVADRRVAILRAVREMRRGDVLLILAKPYPKGQLIGGEYHPFDERQVVCDALTEF